MTPQPKEDQGDGVIPTGSLFEKAQCALHSGLRVTLTLDPRQGYTTERIYCVNEGS